MKYIAIAQADITTTPAPTDIPIIAPIFKTSEEEAAVDVVGLVDTGGEVGEAVGMVATVKILEDVVWDSVVSLAAAAFFCNMSLKALLLMDAVSVDDVCR